VRLSALLAAGGSERARLDGIRDRLLHRAADCTLHMPAQVGDYTDFYTGIQHATNVGRLFRPDNPLMPNYKYVPIGYHGRASSLRPSGAPVRRNGQRKPASETVPSFGPCRNLDYELEIGIWIGPGNELGEPIPIAEAMKHVGGFCLFNDWSARDIQAWEYQPLGPFLSKNFGSTISPWIITPEALEPFRIPQPPRPEGDPAPLDYLLDASDQQRGAFEIELEVLLITEGLRSKNLPPQRLGLSGTRHMYWTVAQLIAHHTCNGCNLAPVKASNIAPHNMRRDNSPCRVLLDGVAHGGLRLDRRASRVARNHRPSSPARSMIRPWSASSPAAFHVMSCPAIRPHGSVSRSATSAT